MKMVSSSGSQAFCLKLNSHQNHLIEAFQKLYNDEVMVDCTLSCMGGTIKAHKLVLSACSPYFTNLFSSFTNPYQYPVVILKDMPFVDLKAIIEFMYKGEVTVPQNILPSVLDSAKALMITGLCDIKIANIETPARTGDSSIRSPSSKKKRKGRFSGSNKISEVHDGESNVESDHSEAERSDSELAEKLFRKEKSELKSEAEDIMEVTDDMVTSENDRANSRQSETGSNEISNMTTPQAGPSSFNQNSRSSARLTPSAAMKANLRQMRIEKLQAITGGLSGRKMWSEEETRVLVKVWEEESARVWASAGKKSLSLKKISDLLQTENVDRDVSQVEGKIKALKRDFKAIKTDKAIPAVQARMAPYLDKLEAIFSREET